MVRFGGSIPPICANYNVRNMSKKQVYCTGDYISQIGRVKRSYKGKPNIEKIYISQNFQKPHTRQYRVNNVLFRNIKYVDRNEEYIGLICQDNIEYVQKQCDALNRLGDVLAKCYSTTNAVIVKFVPIRFLQLTETILNSSGTSLKNEKYHITV